MAKAKKPKQPRIGRPAGRKPLLNLRVDPSLHQRLAKAAADSGRAMSEEAVRLLDYGLQSRSLLEQAINLTFGPTIAGDLMMIGHTMRTAAGGDSVPVDWCETPEIFDRVAKAVQAYFDERNPRGGMVSNERRD
jgi:hypothetical protein